MRVAVIVNSGAGSGSAGELDAEDLGGLFRDAGIEADVRIVPGDRVGEAAQEAVRSGVEAVVAGGGDGTIRAVAACLAGGPIPLGVLPVGTLNHFARDLGIPVDPPAAVRVIAQGAVRSLDLGEVNGEIFVNNSVLGFYPPVVKVRDRERQELQRGKWLATISAAFKVLPGHPPLRIRVRAGEQELERETLFAFIGNNEYEMSAFSYGARSRLDSGNLYLYVARIRDGFGLAGLLLLSLFRDVKATDRLDCLSAPELTIEMKQRTVPVYLDGEVKVLETPLRYRTRVRDLRVILPAGEVERSPAAPRSSSAVAASTGAAVRAAVFLLLLAALTAVLAVRAAGLARQPEELGGIDERKWFHSAGPVQMAAGLGAVRHAMPPGAEVWLSLPAGWDPGWWGWMARYHLPEQRIAGVLRPGSEPPAGAWVVAVSAGGEAAVRRPGRRR